MGKVQNKEFRLSKTQKAVLQTVGRIGLVGAFAVAPGALAILKYFPDDNTKYYRQREAYIKNKVLRRLEQRGYVYAFKKEDGAVYVGLTTKGEDYVTERGLIEKKRGRWDKKWRVVIFDIPEKKSHLRFKLRTILRNHGFINIQKSVWISPWPSEELVALVKKKLRSDKYIILMEVTKIQGSKKLMKTFNL